MSIWIEKANSLKIEADLLLKKLNLKEILTDFGKVYMTGSYEYDLMTWNDIDICLEVNEINIDEIFKLGNKIAVLPNVSTMYFRNEFVLNTQGNPHAIFWCVEIYIDKKITWKIDILIGLKDEVGRILNSKKEIIEKLTEDTRAKILEIKYNLSATANYRKEYTSVDIYRAVLDYGVSTLEQWNEWWKNKIQDEKEERKEIK